MGFICTFILPVTKSKRASIVPSKGQNLAGLGQCECVPAAGHDWHAIELNSTETGSQKTLDNAGPVYFFQAVHPQLPIFGNAPAKHNSLDRGFAAILGQVRDQ